MRSEYNLERERANMNFVRNDSKEKLVSLVIELVKILKYEFNQKLFEEIDRESLRCSISILSKILDTYQIASLRFAI